MESLDLAAYAQTIGRPDAAIRAEAEQYWRELAIPALGLGRVEELAVWLAGVQNASPTRPITRPRAVIFAGDHGIAAAGVSAMRPEATARTLRHLLEGGGTAAILARLYGAELRLVDLGVADDLAGVPADVTSYKVTRGTRRIDQEAAITVEEAEQALRVGVELADAEIDAGADLLIPGSVGVGSSTVAAVLVATVVGTDAAAVTGRGSGIDDAAWIRKCAAVRDALRLARPVAAEPVELLATSAGPDFAAMVGFLLQATSRRVPVLLGGLVPAACALVAQRVAFRASDWWLAADVSPEPAHRKALERMSLEPLREDGIRQSEGVGGLLALPLVRAAATLMAELSTFAAAGIPEPLSRSRL